MGPGHSYACTAPGWGTGEAAQARIAALSSTYRERRLQSRLLTRRGPFRRWRISQKRLVRDFAPWSRRVGRPHSCASQTPLTGPSRPIRGVPRGRPARRGPPSLETGAKRGGVTCRPRRVSPPRLLLPRHLLLVPGHAPGAGRAQSRSSGNELSALHVAGPRAAGAGGESLAFPAGV